MYNPRIPPQLEGIVLRALSKDPANRPASARDFARMLANYLAVGNEDTVIRPVAPRPVQPQPAPQPQPRASDSRCA